MKTKSIYLLLIIGCNICAAEHNQTKSSHMHTKKVATAAYKSLIKLRIHNSTVTPNRIQQPDKGIIFPDIIIPRPD